MGVMSRDSRWLDRVLAVPAIGITIEPWYGFAAGIWDAIERCKSEEWKADGLGNPNVRMTNPLDIRVERDSGFYLALTPSTLVAGYTFNVELQQRPGELLGLRPGADTRTFTQKQRDVASVLRTFLDIVFAKREHELIRVGVAAETRLVEPDAPPGVLRYLADLQGAVRSKLTVVEGSMLAELVRRDEGHDQCHHAMSRNTLDRPDDLGFRLDWQRVWKPSVPRHTTALAAELDGATTAANAYFEHFGSGAE